MKLLDFGGLIANLTGIAEQELEDKLTQIVQDAGEDEQTAKSGVSEYLDKAFSDKFSSISKQQYGRGQKEALQGLEQELRKTYDVESDARGLDLVGEIVSVSKSKGNEKEDKKAAKIETLTADELKQLPNVQQLLKGYITQAEEAKTELESFKTQASARQHAAKVRNLTEKQFRSLNPILPKDETKRQKAIDAFVSSIDPGSVKFDDDGNPIPVDEKGNQVLNAQFNPVSYKDYIASKNWYDVHEQDPDKSSPAAPTNGQSSKSGSGNLTQSQVTEILNDHTLSMDEKKAAFARFENQQNEN